MYIAGRLVAFILLLGDVGGLNEDDGGLAAARVVAFENNLALEL